eukprot:7060771-Prymnesium_polylepis.1
MDSCKCEVPSSLLNDKDIGKLVEFHRQGQTVTVSVYTHVCGEVDRPNPRKVKGPGGKSLLRKSMPDATLLGADAAVLGDEAWQISKISEDVQQLASGLEWCDAGAEEPKHSTELSNERLAQALKRRTKFAEDEWEAFGINELKEEHFIKSGDKYFKPT